MNTKPDEITIGAAVPKALATAFEQVSEGVYKKRAIAAAMAAFVTATEQERDEMLRAVKVWYRDSATASASGADNGSQLAADVDRALRTPPAQKRRARAS